ncbi:MAG: hypothetical protein GXP63_02195 [DPANN group archaeon]|nr:hypothetical protein [DPANN group archaeon]
MDYLDYDMEIEKVIAKIHQEKAKTVCLQLPDGLRPKAKDIQDIIKKETGADVLLWAGSCFGSCDVPFEVGQLGTDLLISWGHPVWKHT